MHWIINAFGTMTLNLLAFAVPFFVFFILVEYWVARRQGKKYFSFATSVSNLNVGIAERVFDVFVTGLFYFVYDYLYQHFALFHVEPSWYSWIILLLCTDLVWYWYHRYGHEVNLLWSLHIVHHQSEEFNYTASTRVTVFQAMARTCFWAILPIFGFPAHMITVMLLIHGLYPFFVHTRTVGKLGWLEYIFVTPSHHRVHHASNVQYLDKNYGDIFIFWDKMFGTYAEEREEPVYGLTKQLNSHSFLWQHFHYWLELYCAVGRAKGVKNKLKILFGSPEVMDPHIREVLERKFKINENRQSAAPALNRYVLSQMIFILCFLFLFLLFEPYFGSITCTLSALFILITAINCGAILERRRWVFHVEFIRLFILSLWVFVSFPSPFIAISLVLSAGIAFVFFERLQQRYLNFVYRQF